MAGMLPGVEAARRRRFHKSNLVYGSELSPTTCGSSSTRRSSFCLYASSHEFHSSSSLRNPITVSQQALCDESRLDAAAREAKKRLDERLQPQRRSETKRIQFRTPNGQQRSLAEMPTTNQSDVPKLKKSGSKRLSWLKLSWKSSEQEECAVCLDQLIKGESLMQLPCAHRFHTKCLVPWLEANAHCPCCRLEIP